MREHPGSHPNSRVYPGPPPERLAEGAPPPDPLAGKNRTVVGNGLFQPIKAIASSGKIFEPYADASTDVTGPRALFCAIQLAGLAMALYKLNSMGLLPTHASDWVSGMKPPMPVEHAYGGTTL